MEYRITFEQCRSNLHGICSRCGGNLQPIETVDNSGNPTFWQGCKSCSCFDSGVDPEIYRIAKELVEVEHFKPYSHIDHNPYDSEEVKKYKTMNQISGACSVVYNVLRIHNDRRK